MKSYDVERRVETSVRLKKSLADYGWPCCTIVSKPTFSTFKFVAFDCRLFYCCVIGSDIVIWIEWAC